MQAWGQALSLTSLFPIYYAYMKVIFIAILLLIGLLILNRIVSSL